MADNRTSLESATERALLEALQTMQRQLNDVQISYEQVKKALETPGEQASGERLANLLPSLVHLQAAGAALEASIETAVRFVGLSTQWARASALAAEPAAVSAAAGSSGEEPSVAAPPEARAAPAAAAPPAEAVDVESLPEDLKALHKKAKRFARITVQELIMYHESEVKQGRENKDLYERLKDDIDKSKKLYDQRYQAIAGHNIDYLYDELVRTLAENDPTALGNYPYLPSS